MALVNRAIALVGMPVLLMACADVTAPAPETNGRTELRDLPLTLSNQLACPPEEYWCYEPLIAEGHCLAGWERDSNNVCVCFYGCYWDGGDPHTGDREDQLHWWDENYGSGGGSYTPNPNEYICNPAYDGPACKLRNELTHEERQRIQASIDTIQDRCPVEAWRLQLKFNLDKIFVWDARVTRVPNPKPLEGNVVNRIDGVYEGDPALWTGYNREATDNVNWTEALAHEILHILYPYPEGAKGSDVGILHRQIFSRAAYCAAVPAPI